MGCSGSVVEEGGGAAAADDQGGGNEASAASPGVRRVSVTVGKGYSAAARVGMSEKVEFLKERIQQRVDQLKFEEATSLQVGLIATARRTGDPHVVAGEYVCLAEIALARREALPKPDPYGHRHEAVLRAQEALKGVGPVDVLPPAMLPAYYLASAYVAFLLGAAYSSQSDDDVQRSGGSADAPKDAACEDNAPPPPLPPAAVANKPSSSNARSGVLWREAQQMFVEFEKLVQPPVPEHDSHLRDLLQRYYTRKAEFVGVAKGRPDEANHYLRRSSSLLQSLDVMTTPMDLLSPVSTPHMMTPSPRGSLSMMTADAPCLISPRQDLGDSDRAGGGGRGDGDAEVVGGADSSGRNNPPGAPQEGDAVVAYEQSLKSSHGAVSDPKVEE